MPADRAALADQLLDAQVEWLLGALTGERFTAAVTREVDELLVRAARTALREAVDVDRVKRAVRAVVGDGHGRATGLDVVRAIAATIYHAPGSDDVTLGELVEQQQVQALVTKLLGMTQLQDQMLDRLTDSPLIATVASRFVGKIATDLVNQNRARAEKLPGMSSMISIGAGVASRAKSVADKQLGAVLGDAADKSAMFALKRTNEAVRAVIREAPLTDAAMELWGLHAPLPVSDLRSYLTEQDLLDLVEIIDAMVRTAQSHPYTATVTDACIDAVFAQIGDRDVAGLLAEIGVERDRLITTVHEFAAPLLAAAVADGSLATLIRTRLEPFYRSPAVTDLLS